MTVGLWAYELGGIPLSLDDSIALTAPRPPKTTLFDPILDASWMLARLYGKRGGVTREQSRRVVC